MGAHDETHAQVDAVPRLDLILTVSRREVPPRLSFQHWIRKIPASMVKDYNKIRVYNPALPEVQDRIAAVKEINTKYDVDGLHMDDYFFIRHWKKESS